VEVSEKRYRYTGKERDEETGFGYHSARYLAPWLGRWTSADPKGMVDGPSLYVYCSGNPVVNNDPDGTQECPSGNCHVRKPVADSHLRGADLDSLPPITFEDVKNLNAGDKVAAENRKHNTEVTLQNMTQHDIAEGNGTVCLNGCHGLKAIAGVGMTTEMANASARRAMTGIGVAVTGAAAVPAIASSGVIGGFVLPVLGGYTGGVVGHGTARAFGASEEVADVFGFVGSLAGAYAGGSAGSLFFAESSSLAFTTEDVVLQSARLPRSQTFSELGSLEVPPSSTSPFGGTSAAKGGYGSWGGRTFDPAAAGGPVRSLTTEGVRITGRGIDVVEGHLARFGPDAANEGMVLRLRQGPRLARGNVQGERSFRARESCSYRLDRGDRP
jgi:RHS repeat-associated protein